MSSPPSPEEIKADRSNDLMAGTIVVFALASIAVLLRFWARKIKNVELWLDDWLVVASWPLCLGLFVSNILAVHWGWGKHLKVIAADNPANLIKVANVSYAIQILWALALPVIKLSILSLYHRVFGNILYMRRTIWTLGIFSVALGVSFALVCAFQCIPVSVAWNPGAGGKCIDTRKFFLSGSAIDMVTWIILLLVPMPAVWNLRKRLVHRIGIIGIFTLGGLTCVISAVRMAQLALNKASSPDTTWDSVQVGIWTIAQPCLGVVCACLPTMTPLLRMCIPGQRLGYTKSQGTYFRNHLETTQKTTSEKSPNFTALGLDSDVGFSFKVDKGDRRLSRELDAIDHLGGSDRNENEVYALTTIEVETDRKRTMA